MPYALGYRSAAAKHGSRLPDRTRRLSAVSTRPPPAERSGPRRAEAGFELRRASGSELFVALHRERIALASVAAVEATLEPALALRARAVCVVSSVRMTERIVADGVSGVHGFFQILIGDLERCS